MSGAATCGAHTHRITVVVLQGHPGVLPRQQGGRPRRLPRVPVVPVLVPRVRQGRDPLAGRFPVSHRRRACRRAHNAAKGGLEGAVHLLHLVPLLRRGAGGRRVAGAAHGAPRRTHVNGLVRPYKLPVVLISPPEEHQGVCHPQPRGVEEPASRDTCMPPPAPGCTAPAARSAAGRGGRARGTHTVRRGTLLAVAPSTTS